MTRGLLAPLSPHEEIALRRIAHGSIVVDAEVTARLVSLALVERVHSSLRLTPLGRLRFDALPKAPLLARQRSVQVTSDYVAGVIEKAQSMARHQLPKHPVTASTKQEQEPQPQPQPQLAAEDDALEDGASWQFVDSFSDLPYWRSRAEINLEKIRRVMIDDRQHQEKRCADSRRRIAISRSLLEATVPVTPAWPSALQ